MFVYLKWESVLSYKTFKRGGTTKMFVYLKWESVLSYETFKRGGTTKMFVYLKWGSVLSYKNSKRGGTTKMFVYLKSGSAKKMPHRGFKLANLKHIGEKKVCVPKIGSGRKRPDVL